MHQVVKKMSIIVGITLLVGTGPAVSAAPSPYADSSPPLLTAGIFRIEAERSYKLSLQVVLRILDAQALKERDRSLATIMRTRHELAGLTGKSTKTARAFAKANSALDDQILALPSLTLLNASSMYDLNEDLINKLNFLSFALESETGDAGSRIVGLALRQASLAQRMAKISLLRSVDRTLSAKRGLQVDLSQSKIEFSNGLALLSGAAGSDRLLRDRIELAKQQWMFYEAALTSTGTDLSGLRNICTTSDRIVELMIEIVRLGYALPPNTAFSSGN